MQLRSTGRRVLGVIFGAMVLAQPATAHVGGLSEVTAPSSVPTWLTLLTGGTIVGASFMFTSLMTDHAAIRAINEWRVPIPSSDAVSTAIQWTAQGVSIGVLLLVIVVGLTGPRTPTSNLAILVVWVGWWAGYTMTVYIFGNSWSLLNPWRTLADRLPSVRRRTYPERLGVWPSVVGLLVMVWIEVVSPVAEEPRLLGSLILGYSAITLAGALLYGPETWFGNVDPISQVFRAYGRIAPFQRTENGIEFMLPSSAILKRQTAERVDETAFVIALLWVTTYDGIVSTSLWATGARLVVGVGVPPLLLYAMAILAGFGLFFAVFRLTARKARQTGGTYLTPESIEGWFVPSLLPIAAGYHVAHFLGYFLTLAPVLVTVLSDPFAPAYSVQVLVLPGWFPTLQLAFILLGHLFAVWVAHALAFDLFPGTLKPIRSQYPFILVMIFYTMTSMWIVTQPFTAPPYV